MMTMMSVVTASMFVSADRSSVIKQDLNVAEVDGNYFGNLANYLVQTNGSGYQHVWPVSFFISVLVL